jgi:hypothetical protein
MTAPSRPQSWPRMLGVCAFNLIVIWILLGKIDPDLRHRLSTMELVTFGVTPTILFYLRNDWPVSRWSVSALGVAAITVLTYSFLHEASHVVGVYAIGSRPVEIHLVPRFWAGEFTTGASVASEPVDGWTGAIPGLAPYIKDVFFVVAGTWILRRATIDSAFLAGLVFVTFCVAPLFDVVNNYAITLLLGSVPGNDLSGTALRWGALWAHAIGIAFTALALAACIRVLVSYSNHPSMSPAGASGGAPSPAGSSGRSGNR